MNAQDARVEELAVDLLENDAHADEEGGGGDARAHEPPPEDGHRAQSARGHAAVVNAGDLLGAAHREEHVY